MLISDTFNIKINILIVKIINNELNALFWKKKENHSWELPSEFAQLLMGFIKDIIWNLVNYIHYGVLCLTQF